MMMFHAPFRETVVRPGMFAISVLGAGTAKHRDDSRTRTASSLFMATAIVVEDSSWNAGGGVHRSFAALRMTSLRKIFIRRRLAIENSANRGCDWFLDVRLAQKLCGFFGRRGIDIEAGAPFEAGGLC